jgi:hypothetical protein
MKIVLRIALMLLFLLAVSSSSRLLAEGGPVPVCLPSNPCSATS